MAAQPDTLCIRHSSLVCGICRPAAGAPPLRSVAKMLNKTERSTDPPQLTQHTHPDPSVRMGRGAEAQALLKPSRGRGPGCQAGPCTRPGTAASRGRSLLTVVSLELPPPLRRLPSGSLPAPRRRLPPGPALHGHAAAEQARSGLSARPCPARRTRLTAPRDSVKPPAVKHGEALALGRGRRWAGPGRGQGRERRSQSASGQCLKQCGQAWAQNR